MPRHISFGDIIKSRLWVSFEFRKHNYGWQFNPGKTYNGTTHGLFVAIPGITILAHTRK